MRRISFLFAVALGLALSAPTAPLHAQDIAGEWTMNVELDAGSGVAIFVLAVDGNAISGTYSGILGDGIEVTGTIEGSSVQFGFDNPDAGEVSFEGTVEGNTMEGECVYGLVGSGTFSGTKG